jgi:hypothetical protein
MSIKESHIRKTGKGQAGTSGISGDGRVIRITKCRQTINKRRQIRTSETGGGAGGTGDVRTETDNYKRLQVSMAKYGGRYSKRCMRKETGSDMFKRRADHADRTKIRDIRSSTGRSKKR